MIGLGLADPVPQRLKGARSWKRATGTAALASMLVGATATVASMLIIGDILATEPVYYGLGTSLMTFIIVSLTTASTPEDVLQEWTSRTTGRRKEPSEPDEPATV